MPARVTRSESVSAFDNVKSHTRALDQRLEHPVALVSSPAEGLRRAVRCQDTILQTERARERVRALTRDSCESSSSWRSSGASSYAAEKSNAPNRGSASAEQSVGQTDRLRSAPPARLTHRVAA